LVYFGYQNPQSIPKSQDLSQTTCISAHEPEALPIYLSFVGIDFIIDSFVTIRLVQILTEGNRSAAEANSIIGRKPPKRTLFTAVLYWNFLRLTIDFFFNAISVIQAVGNPSIDYSALNGLLCFVTITQSYLITVDAEIVKVIEGTRDVPPSSSSTRSISKIMSPWAPSTSNVTRRSQYTPPSTWIRESMLGQRQTGSFQLDKGKIVVVSMQRLSFFEWANMVTGGGDDYRVVNNNNSHIEHETKRNKTDRDGTIGFNNFGMDSARLIGNHNSL
ncbi:2700_t:CDS:2, partial [Racocetra persica]